MAEEATPTGEGTPTETPPSTNDRLLALIGAEEDPGATEDPKKPKKAPGVDTEGLDDDITLDEDDLLDDDGPPEGDPDADDDLAVEGEEEDLEDPLEGGEEFDFSDTTHTVKVDGKDEEVDYPELIKGYSRQAHFTRVSQELATQKEQFQGHAEAVIQEREQYAVLLTQLHDHLQAEQSTRTPEEWATLKAENPFEYSIAKEDERERQEKIQATQTELQQTQQRQSEENNRLFQEHLAGQEKSLLEKLPGWKDVKVRTADLKRMKAYAESLGYSEDEIKSVGDHRLMLLLRDGAAYAALKAKKGSLKGARRTVKGVKPGSRQRSPQPKQKRVARATRERVRKTGKVEDAAAAIAATFDL